MRIYLVRNARPVPRSGWSGEAALRPLGERGFDDAVAIAEHLSKAPIARVIASPMLRCQQTVEPLAVRRGYPVEVDDRLEENEEVTRVLELMSTFGDDEAVVLCSHGRLISALLAVLELGDPGADGRIYCKKGSIWALRGRGKLPEVATYFEPVRGPERDRGFFSPRSISPQSVRVGVLDLGSTSFNLQIADVGPGPLLKPVVREKVMLRLGAVVGAGQRIPDEVCERSVEVAAELLQVARQEKVQRFYAVGTAALRQAKNGDKLARRISKRLGEPVRILSGEEEARTIFRAFQARLDLGTQRVLGVDLGGGSLELAVGRGADLDLEVTFELGAVRLHGELVDSDPMSKASAKAIRKRVRSLLAPHRQAIVSARPERVVAAGGSVRALWRLIEESDAGTLGSANADGLPSLSREGLSKLSKKLLGSTHGARLAMRGMRRSRADLLPTAALILETLAEALDIDGYTICDWGLREGIILEARAQNWFPRAQTGSS